MRIGILEDNVMICEMLQATLELAGHHVSVYTQSTTFLAAAVPRGVSITPVPFDAFIIDLILSEQPSGLQVIHYLRMAHIELPILIISADSQTHIDAALEDLPDIKAFRKPFKITELLAALQT
jgi:DNA-binding response OmpR family regulator